MNKQKPTYTKDKVEIVELLKNTPNGLTLAELSAALNRTIPTGTIAGLVKAGFIEAIGEREISTVGNAKVSVFRFITADILMNEGGKPYDYSESAKEVLRAAAAIEGGLFTLADLSAAAGHKLCSGHINHLVKKGNIEKTDEIRKVARANKREVNVYGFVADIPANLIK